MPEDLSYAEEKKMLELASEGFLKNNYKECTLTSFWIRSTTEEAISTPAFGLSGSGYSIRPSRNFLFSATKASIIHSVLGDNDMLVFDTVFW
ncbi:hypothetical protein TNCV_4314421 [Trichonephila clavipes]|nr:hypothetical protein TNCV_4314421 [Trichonephila clavipes]